MAETGNDLRIHKRAQIAFVCLQILLLGLSLVEIWMPLATQLAWPSGIRNSDGVGSFNRVTLDVFNRQFRVYPKDSYPKDGTYLPVGSFDE